MGKSIQSENELAVRPIGKLVAKFAIPSVVSLTVTALYNIVDQIFIGNVIGPIGNGATNVVFPITALAHGLAMLLGCGCAAYMNLNMGKGKHKEADKGVGNTIVALILLAILLPVLCEILIMPLLKIFGATTANTQYALDYGRIIIAGFPFVILYSGLNQIIRSDGNPKMAMISMFSGAVINVGLDAWFMYGFDWGIKGAAWATIIGQAVSFLISGAVMFRLKNVHLNKGCFKMKASTIGRVCAIGVSSFITQMEIVILTIVMNNVLVKYGAQSIYGEDIPMTAMGIAMKVNSVLTNIIAGIAIGGQPIISYNYGAKKYDRVKKTYKTCLLAAVIVSAVAFLGFQLIPEQIASIFGSGNALYNEFICKSFRIYLMLVILVAAVNVSGVFIQSVGKPVKSSILTLARQVICQCPAIVFFAAIGGVEAALWACPVADAVAFILAVAFMVYEFKLISHDAKSAASGETTESKAVLHPSKKGVIITIAREHGSMGKQVGKVVAEKLGIPYYYKEVTALAAQESGLDKEFISDINKNSPDMLRALYLSTDVVQQAVVAQDKIIRKIADGGSCVIVGRAADYVLREYADVVRIFIYPPEEYRIRSVMEMYGDTAEAAKKHIHRADSARASYYNNISERTWGDRRNYELMIDSSAGIEATAGMICHYVSSRK